MKWLDNERLLDVENLPEHLIIIGGSYIGMEFGQMFHRFGSRVSVLEASSSIMSREDNDISEEARRILIAEGIQIYEGVQVGGIGSIANNGVEVNFSGAEESRSITGTHLLVAVGRVPNGDLLNLPAAGIKMDDRGYIPVDESCMTNVEGIYGVGGDEVISMFAACMYGHVSCTDFRKSVLVHPTVSELIPWIMDDLQLIN